MSQADVLVQMRKLNDTKISRVTNYAQLKDAVVVTEKVKDQAITIPVSAFTDGEIILTLNTDITVQSCAIITTGSPLYINWSCKVLPSDPPDFYYARLYRDATMIYESRLRLESHMIVTSAMTDTPAAGSYTYYLKIYADDHAGLGYQRSLMLLEVKK